MAFTTRFYISLLSLMGLLASACSPAPDSHGFEIRDASVRPGSAGLEIILKQQLQFSTEAVEALENGVPLTVTILTELRTSDTLALLAEKQDIFEIRYLPLSQHYQLSPREGAAAMRTFPRLRHVMHALATVELHIDSLPLAPGAYILRSRTLLDQASLPAPMQLPAALSSQWRHDSEWSQWPFRISA